MKILSSPRRPSHPMKKGVEKGYPALPDPDTVSVRRKKILMKIYQFGNHQAQKVPGQLKQWQLVGVTLVFLKQISSESFKRILI